MEDRLAELSGLMRERELLDGRRIWLSDLCAAADAELRAPAFSVRRLLGRSAAESARLVAAQSRRAELAAALAEVESRRAVLEDVPARYEAVLAEKEQWIRAHGGPAAAALWQLAAERGDVEAALRELDEAAGAADDARRALVDTQRHLDAAGDWSAFDTFFGGGLIASSVKHSRLDQASAAAARADRALAVLRGELADVGVAGPGGITVDGLTRFADIWFDNILTDLAVRDRIGRARRAVAGSLASVIAIQDAVEERRTAARTRLAEIARIRRDRLST
jgi:hypothetical protein